MNSKDRKTKDRPRPSAPTSPMIPPAEHPSPRFRWWREAVESIAVAFILAFLIRSFEAEAFVIPTGSMAPTLLGRHKDVVCQECNYRYQVGASIEREMMSGEGVAMTVCPLCSFPNQLESARRPSDRSYSGDRIIVDKLAYEGRSPERWDVVVFKFPGNAKQNYIKRLVGLPGEIVKIYAGDIYIGQPNSAAVHIARKPARKIPHMLQLVHDTRHIAQTALDAHWPSRWSSDAEVWTVAPTQDRFELSPSGSAAWLRYRHLLPTFDDWYAAFTGEQPSKVTMRPELITDFYTYNAYSAHIGSDVHQQLSHLEELLPLNQRGVHWVGDLALEAEIEIASDEGTLLLDLVEGGRHFTCRIDVATGQAEMQLDDGQLAFLDESGEPSEYIRRSETAVQGAGSYTVRFANVDDQLHLWINDRLCQFDGPTTFDPGRRVVPKSSASDPGDLAPLGIGGENLEMVVDRLRVWRDIYYVATSNETSRHSINTDPYPNDYDASRVRRNYGDFYERFSSPQLWTNTELFDARREVSFPLEFGETREQDQFLVLGDNSPQSSDSRLWTHEHYVERRLLTGRAVFVYWPHAWWVHVPFTPISVPIFPQFRRMGLIH